MLGIERLSRKSSLQYNEKDALAKEKGDAKKLSSAFSVASSSGRVGAVPLPIKLSKSNLMSCLSRNQQGEAFKALEGELAGVLGSVMR